MLQLSFLSKIKNLILRDITSLVPLVSIDIKHHASWVAEHDPGSVAFTDINRGFLALSQSNS